MASAELVSSAFTVTDVDWAPVAAYLAATLDLALRLHPNTRRVFVVAGKARFDAHWEAVARQTFRAYEPKCEFVYLTGLPLLTDYIAANVPDASDIVVCAPDAGRVKTAERLRKELHADLAFLYKRRSRHEAHKIEQVVVVGEVSGRRCVLIDDMVDTAGTIAEGAKALVAEGASQILAAATHPVLSGKAVQRITESPIRQLIVTNTLPIPDDKAQVLGDRLTVLSIAPIVASALNAVFEDESVSE